MRIQIGIEFHGRSQKIKPTKKTNQKTNRLCSSQKEEERNRKKLNVFLQVYFATINKLTVM